MNLFARQIVPIDGADDGDDNDDDYEVSFWWTPVCINPAYGSINLIKL